MIGNSFGWFGQSVVAMLCLIPAWLAIGFFDRNYQVRPDVFLVWYLSGIVVASVFFGGSSWGAVLPSVRTVGVIFLIGLSLGGIANILLFGAVASAPNPGLPVAISNVASIGVFLAAALLARWVPQYFNPVKTDVWSFLGVVLIVIGASLIAIRR